MTDTLTTALTPVLADLDLQLYDLELRGTAVVVTVDRPGGVDLDRIAEATHAISRVLDDVDPVPGRYTLEVTSPGLERRLRTPAHFRRAVGETVTVRTLPEAGVARRVQGVLASADDDGVTLEGDEVPDGPLHLSYGDIERARTVFAWGSQPSPSPSRGRGAHRAARKDTAPTERVTTR